MIDNFIHRYLVQYLAQSGAWLDATTLTGDSAIFESEAAAEEFAEIQTVEAENMRVVHLEGSVS